jgi:hypothetical protein
MASAIRGGVYFRFDMQRSDEFEWDDDNEDKLAARHGVDRYEAEQAATDGGSFIKKIGSATPSTSSWERRTMDAFFLW